MAPGIGCVIRECNEEVRFGIMRSPSSRLAGRDSPERGLDVNEGAMVAISPESRGFAGGVELPNLLSLPNVLAICRSPELPCRSVTKGRQSPTCEL